MELIIINDSSYYYVTHALKFMVQSMNCYFITFVFISLTHFTLEINKIYFKYEIMRLVYIHYFLYEQSCNLQRGTRQRAFLPDMRYKATFLFTKRYRAVQGRF